jgi:hypothetical protein
VADDWQKFRSSENYNKLSYNSNFHWQADGQNGEVAMNYAFLNQKKEWEVFRLYDFQKFENGGYHRNAVLETNEHIKMQLVDIPIANGILRVDKQVSTAAVEMRLGHYALPDIGKGITTETKEVNGKSVTIIDNGEYQLAVVNVSGWQGQEVVSTTGLHPEYDESVVINATSHFDPNQKDDLYIALLLWKPSGESFTDEELGFVKKVKNKGDEIRINCNQGCSIPVKFE